VATAERTVDQTTERAPMRADLALSLGVLVAIFASLLPLLFAVAPEREAADRATEFGWRVATIGPDADLQAAWTGTVDRGVSSGHR